MTLAKLLSPVQRNTLLAPLLSAGWALGSPENASRDCIVKEYHFSTFIEAFAFMTQVALKAEAVNHHPEWFNVYNKVRICWATHDCSGLSEQDTTMAHFCDNVYQTTFQKPPSSSAI